MAVSSGNISAVYIDNWGSGFIGNGTGNFTVPGGTGGVINIYFNDPFAGIIGGYATVNGTDWAYRDSNGNINALPAGSYAVDPASAIGSPTAT